MDEEDYTPYNLNKESIAEQLLFIDENTKGLLVIVVEGNPVSIDLPSSVELIIEDTSPSIKGASASARTKPATMTTGLTVQVPEHISSGDKVKINTSEQKFMGRAD
jgi:elongation factor P